LFRFDLRNNVTSSNNNNNNNKRDNHTESSLKVEYKNDMFHVGDGKMPHTFLFRVAKKWTRPDNEKMSVISSVRSGETANMTSMCVCVSRLIHK